MNNIDYTKTRDNEIRTKICDLMSEMLDNPDENGIYPTSKFMWNMEEYILEKLGKKMKYKLPIVEDIQKACLLSIIDKRSMTTKNISIKEEGILHFVMPRYSSNISEDCHIVMCVLSLSKKEFRDFLSLLTSKGNECFIESIVAESLTLMLFDFEEEIKFLNITNISVCDDILLIEDAFRTNYTLNVSFDMPSKNKNEGMASFLINVYCFT